MPINKISLNGSSLEIKTVSGTQSIDLSAAFNKKELILTYPAGFADTITVTIAAGQVGTYTGTTNSNVNTMTTTKNATNVAFPITLAVGDTLRVVITRSVSSTPATVTFNQ